MFNLPTGKKRKITISMMKELREENLTKVIILIKWNIIL